MTWARRPPPSSFAMSPVTTITSSLRDDREQPQADQREPEEAEADVLDKGSEGRIGDESPVEMAGIAEELELVAVKAVAAVGGDDGAARPRRQWRDRMAKSACGRVGRML